MGHKEFRLKKNKQAWVSVFYPCEDGQAPIPLWSDQKDGRRKVLEYGKHNIRGFFKQIDVAINPPWFIIKYWLGINLQAYDDAELHPDLAGKKLTPVVYSHSHMGNRFNCMHQVKELCAQGCVVFVPTHCDGSAMTHEDLDVDEMKYFVHFFNFRGAFKTEGEFRYDQLTV